MSKYFRYISKCSYQAIFFILDTFLNAHIRPYFLKNTIQQSSLLNLSAELQYINDSGVRGMHDG